MVANKIFVNAYTNKSFKMASSQNKYILHRCHTLSANKAATAVITHEEFEVGLEIPLIIQTCWNKAHITVSI